ncbi:S8 family serine peptidase [Streptomyces rectiverticillatus]|uniref:S8 family serine peptidase n=1 Tax=Streptomyces rectiverticillatus TaxID=173860 RepID=UPI0015C3DD62|nr:S8 family serine peptidase [Streptomyces rectiverticillatus]
MDYQPVDPLFPQQWDMVTIRAGGPGTTGWDLVSGPHRADIAILDSGCDLTHPDLYYAGQGYNPGQIAGDGSPNPTLGSYTYFPVGHGTCCAGIAAGRRDNLKGVCGVAGIGRAGFILPLAFTMFTEGVRHGPLPGSEPRRPSGEHELQHPQLERADPWPLDCARPHEQRGDVRIDRE